MWSNSNYYYYIRSFNTNVGPTSDSKYNLRKSLSSSDWQFGQIQIRPSEAFCGQDCTRNLCPGGSRTCSNHSYKWNCLNIAWCAIAIDCRTQPPTDFINISPTSVARGLHWVGPRIPHGPTLVNILYLHGFASQKIIELKSRN